MAQLIKLQDYISRYEWNAFRYPSQYIRLKQENWKKLYALWNDSNNEHWKEEPEEESMSAFSKVKNFIKGETVYNKEESIPNLPKTVLALKQYFLDKLFPMQLKWATSTVTDVSFMERKYDDDVTLRYFLQRFPDTYLMMYYPIFNVKKAPIEGDIIFISPVGIEIIYLLEKDFNATIMASDERTWMIDSNVKILSPILALKRTEQIIKSILQVNNVDFPVKKIVISRTNNIVYNNEPYNTEIIGKHDYEAWFEAKRKLVSPLKNRQLKAAELLLKHCQSTSIKRPEWDEEETHFQMDHEG
ncbi:nuclease-related domain-containing protein [Virgibacillus ndiopensis]|uniref:nuclease-related domain-containing protein n=1 Tax=Virgibacillus ndiopensis TaxID=2004408 RepID=UPI000C07241C|nr:nuclease-related domain-containing protein [Virgibacillus ndiopensis]